MFLNFNTTFLKLNRRVLFSARTRARTDQVDFVLLAMKADPTFASLAGKTKFELKKQQVSVS